MRFLFFFFIFIFFNGAFGDNITVVNDCGYTVWPVILGDSVLNITGFELTAGASRSLQAPANWSGRIWGRTGCNFNGSGSVSCATGDCGSGVMECNGITYTQPVTIAELNIDWFPENSYHVSIINGFNLPMSLEMTGRSGICSKTGCVGDLNQVCPERLKLEGGGGCRSACQVIPSQEQCCRSLGGESVTCNPTPYVELFHRMCPKSFTYGYDVPDRIDSCQGGDYIVRFCPPTDTLSTIKLEGQLVSTDQLVSIGANFSLGFFGDGFSYLGIWYTSDDESRKVWVANPNEPIISTSGNHALSIDPNTGNLIIVDGGTTLMRITDFDIGLNPNVTATLEDNGNFRLINEIDKAVLWQSFDHPTNVLLPGMKLGYDLKTGQNWTLTSWLSTEIPETGDFTLSWEPIEEASQRLVIRRRGQPYWTGGNLTYQKFQFLFSFNGYKLTSVFNNEQRYISYNIDPELSDYSRFPMWVITPKGHIDDAYNSKAWTPEFCYGYEDSGNGCVEESNMPQCRRKIDRFSYQSGYFSHETSYTTDTNLSLSISDCFLKCWNDCDCVGFNSSNTNGTGCMFWRGSNRFFPASDSNSLSNDPRMSTWTYVIRPRTPITGINTKLILILIGTIIPLFPLGYLLRFQLLKFLKKREHRQEEEKERRRGDKIFVELTASESFKDVHNIESSGGKGNDLLIFSFASIMAATNDFSIEKKLGQGGFGPVYKGELSDGQEIAIKRLSNTSGQGLVEFKNELILIAKLQHTNLVRVLGCCIHREEKMLIYEYMPNRSLDFFLFDENRKIELDWPKRFNIIEGIAQGLLYLHKYSRMRVIHRDLKANNILLDENMNPKISDFGMAKMFKQNETEAMTKRVVGTFGYMSPEYIINGTFSIKSDIFSFGVLILEIISGRKNTSFVHLDRTFNLIGYAWELWQQGDTLELEDTTLKNTCDVQQFLRAVHVALLCVQDSATDRPTTSNMVSMLLNDSVSLPAPNKPAFFNSSLVGSNSNPEESKPSNCSINNMTISVTEGR